MKKLALLLILASGLACAEGYSTENIKQMSYTCDAGGSMPFVDVCYHTRLMTVDEIYDVLASDALTASQKEQLVLKYNAALQK